MSEEKKVVSMEKPETENETAKAETKPQVQEPKKEDESFLIKVDNFFKKHKVGPILKKLPGLTLKVIGGGFLLVKLYDLLTGGKSYTVVEKDAYQQLLAENNKSQVIDAPETQATETTDSTINFVEF